MAMKRLLEYIEFHTVHKNQSAEMCAARPSGPGSCWALTMGTDTMWTGFQFSMWDQWLGMVRTFIFHINSCTVWNFTIDMCDCNKNKTIRNIEMLKGVWSVLMSCLPFTVVGLGSWLCYLTLWLKLTEPQVNAWFYLIQTNFLLQGICNWD